MNIYLAKADEFEKIRDFYYTFIDMMSGKKNTAAWTKNVYPSDEYIKESLENGELYVLKLEDTYAAAMVFNQKCHDTYKTTKWSIEANDNEFSVIHILGVLPPFQNKGLGREMLKKAISMAKEANQKSIRLDVLCGNTAAEKLYENYGFKHIKTTEMFYEDTGWTNFTLYEYVL